MTEAVQNATDKAIDASNPTELEQQRWAVISFERVEGGNLTYVQAAVLLADLDAKGVAGLCVVTDDTAARLAV